MRLSLLNRTALPALAIATLLLSAGADAAEWHRHGAAALPSTASPGAAADAHLAGQQQPLRLGTVTLARRATLPVGSFATVRYAQTYAGLPVLDSAAAVHLAPDGRALATVLQVARDLTLATTPSVTAEEARAAAAALHGVPPSSGWAATLSVWPGARGDQARLVWAVVVPTRDGGFRHLVDAHSAVSLEQRGLARHAQGRVYPISAVVTPMTQDVELLDMVPSTPQLLTGWSGNFLVANYNSGNIQDGITAEQTLTPNVGMDFLYDPPVIPGDATDGFAQVGIYYHMTRYRDYFAGSHGLDFSGPSWKLTAVANITNDGTPLDNAFFSQQGIGGAVASPNLIGIGQGSSFDFADDSDVFLHEMTHYVSHNAVGFNGGQAASTSYGLSPFGGSIDEGISDYFACTINGDPILGEASLALLSSARDLTDTSKRCTEDMVAEVHADGEIIGSFSWSLREAFGAEIGDQLVWGATSLLTPNPSMGDYARGVQQVAAGLQTTGQLQPADIDTIDALIEARGLHECDEEVPLREGEPRTGSLFGLDLLGQLLNTNCAGAKMYGVELQSLFHYEVTPDPEARGITVDVDLTPLGGGELDWGLYARAGEHVTFSTQSFLPQVDEFDHALTDQPLQSGSFTIDASSDPPFDPNATYHFVLVHQNCPMTQMSIALTQLTDDPSGAGGAGGSVGSGGAGGTGDDVVIIDDGCGCRLAGRGEGERVPASGWSLLLLGAGLLLARRRTSTRYPGRRS